MLSWCSTRLGTSHSCRGPQLTARPLLWAGHQPQGSSSTCATARSSSTSGGMATGDQSPSIFRLAQTCDDLASHEAALFHRLFKITTGMARCSVGEELALKYSMEQNNAQLVVSITNVWTHEQTWFNEVRTRKPQTFKVGTDKPVDPTGGGGPGKCDFCSWHVFTAQDPWGRIEAPHAVTSSNLFKYGEPFHGLALFKAHDPLDFSYDQLSDLLAVSQAWFAAAEATHTRSQPTKSRATASASAVELRSAGTSDTVATLPRAHTDSVLDVHKPGWPYSRLHLSRFFIWNALPRAGASQFHGHAQLMATAVPVPAQAQLNQTAASYAAHYPGSDYVRDLLSAHRAAGLLRACAASPESAAAISAHTLADQHQVPARAWVAAHLSPVKDMEVLIAIDLQHPECSMPLAADNGHHSTPQHSSLPTSGIATPAFARALHATLRALIDTLGVESFNVGILNVPDTVQVVDDVPPAHPPPRFLLARVVSRGRMSQPASDFGCLEVLGGASIGHTDPYKVLAAVEDQLSGCLVCDELPE